MKINVANSYEKMSAEAADGLIKILHGLPQPLLCPASGHTPTGLYKKLVAKIKERHIDSSRWHFVGLDEWAGMNEEDEGSCRHYLNKELFVPLQIKGEQICFFNGKAADLRAECNRVESFVKERGGIDIAVVGVGLNGHIGMNEPGTSAFLYSHVTHLAKETQTIGQKYFSQPKDLSKGLTLGLATLLAAKHIFLLANGRSKAGIVKKFLEEPESEQIPATVLKKHPNLTVYLDHEAAHLIG